MLASTRLDHAPGLDIHTVVMPTPAGPVPTPMPFVFGGLIFSVAETALAFLPDAAALLASVADAVTGAEAESHGALGSAIVLTAEGIEGALQLASAVTDPIELAANLARGAEAGGRVKINGLWATKAGDSVMNILPHQVMSPAPILIPPSDSADLNYGARNVYVENHAPVRMGDESASCSEPISAPGRVLALPKGSPVLIQRPPTLDLLALASNVAGWLVAARLRDLPRTRWMRGLSARIQRALPRSGRRAFKDFLCWFVGEPVDVSSGAVVSRYEDLSLPGPIPLVIGRRYNSSMSGRDSPLGHGWHLSLDQRLWEEPGRVVIRWEDGREIEVDTSGEPEQRLGVGHAIDDVAEDITVRRVRGDRWEVEEKHGWVREYAVARGAREALLTRIRDAHGRHSIDLTYDAHGRLEWVRDACGRLVGFEHDGRGRLRALKAPLPHGRGWYTHRRYEVDEHGDLVRASDAKGGAWSYEYVSHLKVRKTDRLGLSWYYQYDGVGGMARCVRTWGEGPPPPGRGEQQSGLLHRVLHYLPYKTIVEDGAGLPTTYVLTEEGLVREVIDPEGGKQITERDPVTTRLLSETDPIGRTTRYRYNARAERIAEEGPDGSVVSIERDEQGRPVRVLDATGAETRFSWSYFGELIERTDALGGRERAEHERGLLVRAIDPMGRVTQVEHEAGLPTRVVLPNGGEIRIWYDGLGRIIKERDPRGAVREWQYDAEGNIVRERTRAGVTHVMTYDAEDNLTSWTDGERVTRTKYGSWHLPIEREEGGAVMRIEHDNETRPVAVINEIGERTQLVLDVHGRIREERDWAGRVRRYERDASGAVTRLTTPSGTTTFAYDAAGRLVEVSGPLGAKQVYGYDRNGRLVAASTESSEVRFERDALGRVVREWQRHEGADWVEVERAYDPDHALRALTSSLGARQSIARDALGAPVEITCAGLATRMWRDVGGLETARETGTLRMWWTRDAAGRPRSRQVGSELQRFEWRSEARLESLETSAGLTRYEHDARGRLVGLRRTDGARQVRAHDLVGNVYQREDLRDRRYGPGGLLEQTHDATYEHDDEGRRSRKVMPDGTAWSYHWDGRGQLAQVERPDGVIVENRYDALARRVQKRVRRGDEVISDTRFVWSGDRLAHEVTVANGREDKTTWYWDPESLAPLARERGGVVGAIVTDHLGTPTEIHDLDREGVAHLAWRMQLDLYGVAYVDVGDRTDCNLRWPGQYEDQETGLYENRHRHYDPATGRYISPDPIGLLGGLGLYRYVDDPLSQTDPWGLFFGRTSRVDYWTNDFQNELNAAYRPGGAWVSATERGTAHVGGNVAIVKLRDGTRHVFASDGAHSEQFMVDWLDRRRIGPADVRRIYSERSPCVERCLPLLQRWLGTHAGGVELDFTWYHAAEWDDAARGRQIYESQSERQKRKC